MEEVKNNNSDNEKFKEANISLIIDTYEDIFSDFDPRPFLERALSVDFLDECKRAARDKDGNNIELRILVPKTIRNFKEEWKIKKRIKEHFLHHLQDKEKKLSAVKRTGILWVLAGMAILAAVSFGAIKYEENMLGTILPLLLDVPCWFLIWEGMGKIWLDSKEIEPEHEFYKKMSRAEVNFTEY